MEAFELVNAASAVVSAVAAVVSTAVAVVTLSVQRQQAASTQEPSDQEDASPEESLPGWMRMPIGALCVSPS